MVRAVLNDVVLAESSETKVVEGNHYFPPQAIAQQYFKDSETHTVCGWKGTASYYSIDLGHGAAVKDAAWYYPSTKDKAKDIEGYVAFYKNKVQISE